jgi:hypothetical protein
VCSQHSVGQSINVDPKSRLEYYFLATIKPVVGLLGLLARIPSGTWMSSPCECCVLEGRGLQRWSDCVCLIECDQV